MTKIFYSWLVLTLLGMQLSIAQKSKHYQTSVYFAYKNSELDTKAKVAIRETFDQIQTQPSLNYRVVLTGLADSVGDVTANHILAQDRALAVKKYAVSLGMVADKIAIKVLGERPANTEEEHHRNRRVDIVLHWQNPVKVVEAAAKKPKEVNIQDFFDAVEQTQQTFVIDNSRDTILVGKQGTRMLFYAHSLYAQEGSPVTIKLREYYNYADMIMAQLTTTSGKRLLETGGMLQIIAMQNGKEVQLKNRKNVLLMLPTNRSQENMQVFNGERGNEGFIDWRLNRRGNVLRSIGGLCIKKRICWLRRLFSRELRARHRRDMGRMTEADKLLLAKLDEAERKAYEEANKDAYIMNSSRLGWLNCDVIINTPSNQLTKVNVQIPPNHTLKNTRYFVALHKRRSLISGYQYYHRKLRLIRLPKGEKATLIALEYKDNKVLIASEEVRIDEIVGKNLHFEAYTIYGACEAIKKLTSFEKNEFAKGR